MSTRQKLIHELKAILVTALYFGIWFAGLLVIKWLVLAEYRIAFHGFSMAIIGALVLSKVVMILEHVPLGPWVRNQAAWVDVLLRTWLYALGVFVVLILEKGIEGRHEHGGFGGAVEAAFQSTDAPHVWVNIICISAALLIYNATSVIRRHLGKDALIKLFLKPHHT